MGCGSSKVNTFSAPSDRSSSSRNPTTARPSMKTLSIATEPLVFVTTANAVDTNEIRIAGPNRNDAMRNNRIAPLQTETKEQDIDRKELEKRENDKKELEKKEIDSPKDEKLKQLQNQPKKESHDTHESGLLHRDLKNILNPNNMIAAIKRGDLDSVKQLVESHEHGNENENGNENLAINCLGMKKLYSSIFISLYGCHCCHNYFHCYCYYHYHHHYFIIIIVIIIIITVIGIVSFYRSIFKMFDNFVFVVPIMFLCLVFQPFFYF